MTDHLHDLLSGLVEPLPPMTALDGQLLTVGARRRRAKLAGASASVVAAVGVAVLLALPSPAATPRVVLGVDPSASPAPSPAAVTPAPTTAATSVTLVLEPDGLGYVSGAASSRHLTFADADATSVQDLVTRALGPGTSAELPDCGPGVRVVDYRGFSVYLNGTRFVGWSDSARPGPRTADGVGLGTTLSELRQAFASVSVTTGTVGPEWSTPGGLAGGLDGTLPTSRVTRIGAGTTCVFR